jgi:hypothetical protein
MTANRSEAKHIATCHLAYAYLRLVHSEEYNVIVSCVVCGRL